MNLLSERFNLATLSFNTILDVSNMNVYTGVGVHIIDIPLAVQTNLSTEWDYSCTI